MTAEGSLLLALVIAPEATAREDLLICRKLASNGEKKTPFVEEAIQGAVSLLQAIAFITEHIMLLE